MKNWTDAFTDEEKEKLRKRAAFQIYRDNEDIIEDLTAEEQGNIFRELFRVASLDPNAGEQLSPMEKMAFKSIRKGMVRDMRTWIDTCNKNSENIRKRWKEKNEAKKNTSEYDPIQSNTTVYEGKQSYTSEYDPIRLDSKQYHMDMEMDKERIRNGYGTDMDRVTDLGRGTGGTRAFFEKPTIEEFTAFIGDVCESFDKKLSEKQKQTIYEKIKGQDWKKQAQYEVLNIRQ